MANHGHNVVFPDQFLINHDKQLYIMLIALLFRQRHGEEPCQSWNLIGQNTLLIHFPCKQQDVMFKGIHSELVDDSWHK